MGAPSGPALENGDEMDNQKGEEGEDGGVSSLRIILLPGGSDREMSSTSKGGTERKSKKSGGKGYLFGGPATEERANRK